MPFCEVTQDQKEVDGSISGNAIKIFYETYGRGSTKVLLITAGTRGSWDPQIKGLTGTDVNQEGGHHTAVDLESSSPLDGDGIVDGGSVSDDDGIEVCSFDNCGMGRSFVPQNKSKYTTIMARDALALMDHLGWKKAHVFGHSMGAIIASKLASIAPERILSLALLDVTGGVFECFPKVDRKSMSIALRFFKAKTPEQRADVDLDTHYTEEYLNEYVGNHKRRMILHQFRKGLEYTGQVNACWTHMSSNEYDVIRSSGFLVSIIHGRDDIIAQISHARKIAEKLYPVAKMIKLDGTHLVSHEKPVEVNEILMDLIKASESTLQPIEWSNLFKIGSGEKLTTLSWVQRTSGFLSTHTLDYVMKLQFSFLYLLGSLSLLLENGRNAIQNIKPVRIALLRWHSLTCHVMSEDTNSRQRYRAGCLIHKTMLK